MTTQDQQFLISVLNLSKKLKANDTTVMDDIAVINNYATISDEQKIQVDDIVRIECEDAKALNKELLKTVVNALPFVDQAYLLELIEFATLDLTNFETYKAYINAAITKEITFKKPLNELVYFKRIVNACITLRDQDLTAKAIDRIQSIHAV
jgi:hypothetical protein